MYSALRKKLSAPRITHPSYFVGLLLRGCSLPHANFGHVVLAKPSPILFYPISSTEVSRLHRDDWICAQPTCLPNHSCTPALLHSCTPLLHTAIQLLQHVLQCTAQLTLHGVQVRTLVDVPGEKLPSAATGALQEYLRTQVGPQVRPLSCDSIVRCSV